MRAIEQDEAAILEERQAWPETIAGIAVERFVFLDESAARTDLVRSHGWSPCGERAPGTAPCGHWERVTILGALGPEGIVAAMSIPAATDGAVFCAWLEQVLLPELRRIRPDAVLVMDNLAAHKTQAVRALLDGSGFAYRYLPRYSPDSEPDRARLGQGEGPVAQGRGTDRRRPPCRPRPSLGRHHQGRRQRLLSPCRLCLSQLACGLL